ncbi:hypothetical protein [Kaistia terrae]|uniref:Restriction endonuclease n=1 Tax=Kaistia terrae TaxID=537017 RepID=A0ABW0PRV0_9HYPH|nr:hypothetical protein [Kaistia terrae]MCX5578131.1 hypothetical protein [Kaistia terrae]
MLTLVNIKSIEVRQASDAISKRVHAWFQSDRRVGFPDGSRSIHLPHPEKSDFTLKIKGAGLNGGAVRFGVFSKTGPAAKRFDFDGRVMDDVASGHDNAFLGGASFQQASTEFHVSQLLAGRGVAVVPCLGYGRVDTDTHASWFSIFEWKRDWRSGLIPSPSSGRAYGEANIRLTNTMLQLAVEHDLIGYCGHVLTSAGQTLLKDLHPFHRADPISMSQLSWVMQVLFALNIRCHAARQFSIAAGLDVLPDDIVAYPLRAIVPDANFDDYAALRDRIVKPYMIRAPDDFSPRALHGALRSIRVSSALLDLCPPQFTRW